MTARLRATILGCGSSAGVPRIGGDWGACDPAEPKNRAQPLLAALERVGDGGTTRVLVDTPPDLRAQLLAAGVGLLDGVVFTHPHADHIHGIDDLRTVVHNRGSRLPVWADAETTEVLISRFAYVFVQPPGSLYPPILDLRAIDGPFAVDGAGGPLAFRPFRVQHGRIEALGFRVDGPRLPARRLGDPRRGLARLRGARRLGARRAAPQAAPDPHPSRPEPRLDRPRRPAARGADQHAQRPRLPRRSSAELPPGVEPAYDGMTIELGR